MEKGRVVGQTSSGKSTSKRHEEMVPENRMDLRMYFQHDKERMLR